MVGTGHARFHYNMASTWGSAGENPRLIGSVCKVCISSAHQRGEVCVRFRLAVRPPQLIGPRTPMVCTKVHRKGANHVN